MQVHCNKHRPEARPRTAFGVRLKAARPSIESPLTPPFHIIFAAFDFLRMPFAKTSQVNIHLTV